LNARMDIWDEFRVPVRCEAGCSRLIVDLPMSGTGVILQFELLEYPEEIREIELYYEYMRLTPKWHPRNLFCLETHWTVDAARNWQRRFCAFTFQEKPINGFLKYRVRVAREYWQ
jgi:hypothetical protein